MTALSIFQSTTLTLRKRLMNCTNRVNNLLDKTFVKLPLIHSTIHPARLCQIVLVKLQLAPGEMSV